jgi:hypothetical protein
VGIVGLVLMDVYLGEELYDILTYNIQNPNAPDFESKKKRMDFRIKDGIGRDAKPYRSW